MEMWLYLYTDFLKSDSVYKQIKTIKFLRLHLQYAKHLLELILFVLDVHTVRILVGK